MKRSLAAVILFQSLVTSAQLKLQGEIEDAATGEPLPYATVIIKNKGTGVVANSEGSFILSANPATDTFIVRYVGYKDFEIPVLEFTRRSTIRLVQQNNTFEPITVYASNNALYKLLEKCRSRLLESRDTKSKTYFVLETHIGQQPVELIECYYNAKYNDAVLKELTFKNGRVGLAPYDDTQYFLNLNTSKAFTFIDLVHKNAYLPVIPLQLSGRQLKRFYELTVLHYNSSDSVYHIAFNPRIKNGDYFHGTVWIDARTAAIGKITLQASTGIAHPFLPRSPQSAIIENVEMTISKTFRSQNNETTVSHIDFDYKMRYRHLHNRSLAHRNPDTVYLVTGNGLMYFYDKNQLFLKPYFQYDENIGDYSKITALTYNQDFWERTPGLIYSEKMKKAIGYFRTQGNLFNYQAGWNRKDSGHVIPLFENNYLPWSDQLRLSIKKHHIRNDTNKTSQSGPVLSDKAGFVADQYALKVQIFFDINPSGDSFSHFSATIFDIAQSFYNLRQDEKTNCFMNIHFDLYEIARRRMENELKKPGLSPAEMESIYKRAVEEADNLAALYTREVNRGRNMKAFSKWNSYVKEKLGIDNFERFGIHSFAVE